MAGMVQHLTGWLDYDRPFLHLLEPNERIDYFEKRVRLVVVNPLARILDNEIHVALDSSALLIFGVAICSAIEATGKLQTGCLEKRGRDINKKRFHAFLKHYMASEYETEKLDSKSYGDMLFLRGHALDRFPQRPRTRLFSVSWRVRRQSG